MKKLLASLAISLGLITGANATESTNLLNSVGQLFFNDSATCSVSKIAKNTFLTAGHCVKGRFYDADKFEVKYQSGPSSWPDSRAVVNITVGTRARDDWAILKTEVDIEEMDTLSLDCTYEAKVRDEVETAGYPSIMGKSYYKGYVSSVEKIEVRGDFWLDISSAHGASGSPIVHNNKQVGILVTGVMPNGVGLLAVGVNRVGSACDSPSSYGAGSIRTVNPGEFLGGPF